jgi:NAD(P)-dependent dehydrogenase (short-subunit alcohol dehydrogenase family)
MSLDGEVVFLTGGGSGLGRGLVESFLEEDAKVVVLESVEEKADALRKDFADSAVAVITGDVRSRTDNARAVAAAVEQFGKLDVFVQCAGITDWVPALTLLPDDDVAAAFTEIMQVNVLGPLLGALACAAELRKSEGSMIFSLSTSAFLPGGQGGLYTLSKHSAVGLVRQLAYEMAPAVRVNAVVPGPIKESRIGGPVALGQSDLYPEKVMPGIEEMLKGVSPLRSYPAARDYAPIYLLLADRKRARIATGSIVPWDTGISLVGHGTAAMELVQQQTL